MRVAPFDFQLRTRIVFGDGSLSRLGELAGELGFRRPLLTADPGIVAAGHAERALKSLRDAGIDAVVWSAFGENPDTAMIASGAAVAREESVDSLVGLGGGSSLDTAKGIAFLLSNGGDMRDYWGYGKAQRPLPPMIGIPTTAGTGSEAQSYALISDAESHVKMACGDPGAACRVAILDPELTATQPTRVAAVAGYDALSHAVESFVTTKRNALSDTFSREAFRLLEGNLERVLLVPSGREARAAMLLGAHYAGIAIEASMLGATHACANPLTARHGTPHGIAIGLLLPHVVRWNAAAARDGYAELAAVAGLRPEGDPATALAARLEELAVRAGLPRRLRSVGVEESDLLGLAKEAAEQWTGRFNPRPFNAAGALALYQAAI
ncbi:MAG TPA: iron-containing alcohol dehydrogenase [Vicinamibacteria bacterium]